MHSYTGRFAPSPSGPLHAGSLVAAMASYLDARAHQGRWLLRIEDIDTPRVVPGADRLIMGQLQALGMQWDEAVVWQSHRHAAYQAAFDALATQGLVYGCACTRKELFAGIYRGGGGEEMEPMASMAPTRGAATGAATKDMPVIHVAAPLVGANAGVDTDTAVAPYPGTCRNGLPPGRTARAWRFRVSTGIERFDDRWLGAQQQDVEREVGDFILKRADGLWAYQLAVVVDDTEQGVSDIVRGTDLLSSTARQQMLARHLGRAFPRVMHVPLVIDAQGRKLSKQNHAPALDCTRPLVMLNAAWQQLGFEAVAVPDTQAFWAAAQGRWAARFSIA
jgi:glutamyl-Q tRNA(Asp) synthetase